MDQKGSLAKVHIISVVPKKYADYTENSEEIDKIVTKSPLPIGAKIGDLIVEKNVAGYRTDGVYIVGHDKKIMELSSVPDDYGTLPEEFRIWKFINPRTKKVVNCDYWYGALCRDSSGMYSGAYWHNNMVYFDPGDFNLYFDRGDLFKANIFGSKNYAVSLDIGGQKYYISQDYDLTKRKFLDRINTPGYIEMCTDDAEKKYRSTTVFRV